MQPAKQFDLCPWGKLIAMPHMGWQHAGWFASYVVNAKNILEWGCGGSTLWMAQMNTKAALLSMEHSPKWFDVVDNLDRQLREVGIIGDAVGIVLCPESRYVRNGYIEDGEPYDLIFVDGHVRPACLDASYDLLEPGGVVFLHDSQRVEYTEAKRKLLERPGMTLIDERTDESWVNPRAGMWGVQKDEAC